MSDPTTEQESAAATATQVLLPLAQSGVDPRPEGQIRPLSEEGVRHHIEEPAPAAWDPITVRAWPERDPYPPGEEGRPWQVVGGYHRVTAARELALKTLSAHIIQAATDAEYWIVALASNLRHGEKMTTAQQVAVLRRLRAAGVGVSDLSRQTGIPKKTLQNWLAGRDTNAARLPRNAASNPRSDEDGADAITIATTVD